MIPKAPVINVTDEYFDIEVTAPYRWMENLGSDEFRQWLETENEYGRGLLDGLPERQRLLEGLYRLDTSLNRFPAVLNRIGDRFFYMLTLPPSDVFQLYRSDAFNPLSVNPNVFL